MEFSVHTVQAVYDKVYANPGLMGTQLDREYSRVTKTSLLNMCSNAPNLRILDIGTGDGDLWQFAPVVIEWHAIDVSPVGTRRALGRFPRLRAAVAISECLPYPDHFFGAAIAVDTIEHVFDIQTSLREVRRVLVPGGKFALSVPTPNSLRKWAYNRLLRRGPSPIMLARLLWTVARRILLFGRATFQPIDRDLSPGEWCSLLETAGFNIVTTVEWPAAPLKPIVYLIGTQAQEKRMKG
jgi:ubiquinone/menaquinone biosynthesis C-methylase UbiE